MKNLKTILAVALLTAATATFAQVQKIDQLRVTTNVGIGTGAITPNAKLHVINDVSGRMGLFNGISGNIQIESSVTDFIGIHIRPDAGKGSYISFTENAIGDRWVIKTNPGSPNLVFATGNTSSFNDRITFDGNGNVGIGTTTPSHTLSFGGEVVRTINMERRTTDAAGQSLTIRSGGAFIGGTDRNGGNIVLSSGTSTGTGTSAIQFQTATAGTTGTTDNAPTTKMTILGNGNVGIGTPTPESKLAVIAGGSSTSYLATLFLGGLYSVPSSYHGIGLGINSTTKASGGVYITEAGVVGTSLVFTTSPNYTIATPIQNEVMRITDSGRVGIGTAGAAPTSKLQVVGLAVHADNNAAIAAGLTAGAFYHAGDGIVRVVF